MKGLSLFASAGVGELLLEGSNVEIVVANELVPQRGELYQTVFPNSKMIIGDITDDNVFKNIMDSAIEKEVSFLLASPPCQGMSIVGKNRTQEQMAKDKRNDLIFRVIECIDTIHPKYVLIENVSMLLKILYPYEGKMATVMEILTDKYADDYEMDAMVVNSADYGVPQTRHRAIIKMNIKGTKWLWPNKCKKQITVAEAIGHLPSLESGESSDIKWHFARNHDPKQVEWMKHTPTGCSAITNNAFYPVKANGERVVGYESSYRRIRWDAPAPTITIRNDAISSQRNVHPGRLLPDGTYSDARVLTMLETFIVSSIPKDIVFPEWANDTFLRTVIGEGVPPKLLYSVITKMEM